MIMKKTFNIKTMLMLVVALSVVSCTKNLTRKPFYDVTSASVYTNFNNYKLILAKMYAGIAVSGQKGPDGSPDLVGFDEGFSSYLRQFWQLQELTTDEAVIAWNDGTIKDLHYMTWTPSNEFIRMMYDRIFYQISLCNEFIRQTKDGDLAANGISGANANEARKYRAEARFLRALSYYHALDLFGNVPFVTDADPVGSFFPDQISRANLFAWLETELKSLETSADMADPKTNEYGRVDKAGVWALLAKMYLNAEVYTGTAHYTDCITYCNKIINAGYSLTGNNEYNKLFLADNNSSVAKNENIFIIEFDGLRTKSWGAMTYLVHAPVGGSMNPANFGINGGWSGLRSTKSIYNLFQGTYPAGDSRATFYTSGQNIDINDIATFTDGYPITKYKNVKSTGGAGSDPAGNFPDTDFPLFRLGDVYLMYAESVLRGGSGGSAATALNYVNALKQRAYGNTSGNITSGQLTLDYILDERGRELNWEATRRTDLIRFGKFTGSNYLWQWKGNTLNGAAVGDYRKLFPIPATDIAANPKLVQNTGY